MKKSSRIALLIIFISISLIFPSYYFYFIEVPRKSEIENQNLTNLQGQICFSNDSFDWTPIESVIDFTDSGVSPILDGPHTTIAYNPLNNIEILEENDIHTEEFNRQVEEYKGLLDVNYGVTNEGVVQSSYIFPPDDRVRVGSPSSYPWRTICKLYITAQDGSRYSASGAIIDNFHVLTCGHCVYLHDDGGWAAEIKVAPGTEENDEPFGHAYATNFRMDTEYTVSRMTEHDWAVLTLDRNLGIFTGWMGRQTANSSSSIYTGVLNTAGYPGDLDSGDNMYYVGDSGDRADEYNHYYWMDSASGQSGSPVWIYELGNHYIVTVHTHGYMFGSDANAGTRLNSDKYDRINIWLSNDSSTPPDDKADLSRGYGQSSFSTTDVLSGQTNFKIYYDVKNSGTATASSFRVSFYASEDTAISSSDYLIGTKDITDLLPFDTADADWRGVFPSDIPEGSYYIGLIIDSENWVNEFEENDNIVVVSLSRIDVNEPLSALELILILVGVIAVVGIIVVVSLRFRSKAIKSPEVDYREYYSEPFEIRKTSVYQNRYQGLVRRNLPKFCSNCGTKTVSETKFCINCGKDFSKF